MQNVLTILAILTGPQYFIASRFFASDIPFIRFEIRLFSISAVCFGTFALLHIAGTIHSNLIFAAFYCIGSGVIALLLDHLPWRELGYRT